jgi:hypothetical protein
MCQSPHLHALLELGPYEGSALDGPLFYSKASLHELNGIVPNDHYTM